MEQFHRQLSESHAWYANWHTIPYVSVLHFVILITVGYGIASYTASAAEALAAPATQAAPQASAPRGDVSDVRPHPGTDFGPWHKISQWKNCKNLMQQGSIFEVQNAVGQSMWSECTSSTPKSPVGWHSEPTRFRLVKEPLPKRSEPHPLPQNIDTTRP
jgi:hypothetical protein